MFSQNLAIVIGINQYANGIACLQTAAQDATVLAQLLTSEHEYDVHLLVDAAATKTELLALLSDRLPQLVTPDSRLLFYFAGHGVALDGDDGPAGYLVPQDADLADNTSFLSMQVLHDALTALPCRHSLIILDCCFSGAFRWSSTRDVSPHPEVIYQERFDRFIRSPAWQVITSAAYDQTASDRLQDHRGQGYSGNHSPFAEALFNALRGQADRFPVGSEDQPSGDGVITATELYLYLRDCVELATGEARQPQTPGLWPLRKHDRGEYIFLVPGHELNLPPAPELNADNNPYRGLEAFDEAQAHLYFGRQQLVADLHEFVQEHSLTVVLGPSGTGKSSLVKAGLIPALRNTDLRNTERVEWQILPPIRPGNAPLKALARAILSLELAEQSQTVAIDALAEKLAQDSREFTRWVLAWDSRYPKKPLLLVIDQFEELITQCRDERERQQFLELLKPLCLGKMQGKIVVTLRSDFEPQFQPWLADAWMQSRIWVKPMTQDELRQAIEAPAAERVMVFEPYSLVDQLINEVVQMPGALPLLSFTLSELYLKYLKRQDGNRALTQTDYEALGGVAGSLTQRATQEYEALKQQDPAYEHTMKRIMLRMVAIEGSELARRRVLRSELVYADTAENARVETVIRRLTAARLVVKGQDSGEEPYVEPAHDVLMQGWPQLQRWKNNREEQENLSLQRLLTPAAREWANHQNDKKAVGFLWNANPRLELLRAVLLSSNSWLNSIEKRFVELSLQQKKRNHVFRWSIAAGVIMMLSGAAFFSNLQRIKAEKRSAIALAREADVLFDAGQELEAIIKAIEAGKLIKTSDWGENTSLIEVNLILQKIVYGIRVKDRIGPQRGVIGIALNPTYEIIATYGRGEPEITLWGFDGKALKNISAGSGKIKRLAFSPDGKTLIAAGSDAINSWSLDYKDGKYEIIEREEFKRIGHFSDVDFTQDGEFFVAAGPDNAITIRTADGERIIVTDPSRTTAIDISDDSQMLVTVSGEKVVQIRDINTSELITLLNYKEEVLDAFFLDKERIVVALKDGTLEIRGVGKNPQEVREMNHGLEIYAVELIRNQGVLASAGYDGQIKIWDTEEGGLQQSFYASVGVSEGKASELSSSSDHSEHNVLVSSGTDDYIRFWNLLDNSPVTLTGNAFAVNPKDQTLIISQNNRLHHCVPTEQEWMCKPYNDQKETEPGKIELIRIAPDGNLIAAIREQSSNSGSTSSIEIQQAAGESNHFFFLDADIIDVDFDHDGRYIAVSAKDKKIRIWELDAHGDIISFEAPFEIHDGTESGSLKWLDFSPKKSILISGDDHEASNVTGWSLDGKRLFDFSTEQNGVRDVEFSPDGQLIASAGRDRTLKIWNRDEKLVAKTESHSDPIRSVQFDSSEAIVVTVSDGSIYIWDSNGELIQRYAEYSQEAVLGAFSENEEYLVSVGKNEGEGEREITVRTIKLDTLLQLACDWSGRYLEQKDDKKERSDEYEFCKAK